MKRKKQENEEVNTMPVTDLEEIRQRVKKQELQTIILKKIIEKTKETKQNK
jgi:hypothetical protein